MPEQLYEVVSLTLDKGEADTLMAALLIKALMLKYPALGGKFIASLDDESAFHVIAAVSLAGVAEADRRKVHKDIPIKSLTNRIAQLQEAAGWMDK